MPLGLRLGFFRRRVLGSRDAEIRSMCVPPKLLSVDFMFNASTNEGGVWRRTSAGVATADVVLTYVISPDAFYAIFDSKSATDSLAQLAGEMTTHYNFDSVREHSKLQADDYPLEGKLCACAYRPHPWVREEPSWVR